MIISKLSEYGLIIWGTPRGNPDSNDNLKTNKEIIDWIPAFAGMTQISEWELKKMAFKNSSHFKFIGVHF